MVDVHSRSDAQNDLPLLLCRPADEPATAALRARYLRYFHARVQYWPHRRAVCLTKTALNSSVFEQFRPNLEAWSEIGCRQRPQKIT